MTRRALALACAGLVTLPGAAGAAYTPKPGIELSTRAPSAAPAIHSTLTQPSGQSATRTIAARFPPAFTYNPRFSVPGCEPADEQAGACPAESRIGTIGAMSAFGPGEGPVHLTTDLRLVGFIRAYAGLAEVRAVGRVSVLDDGSAEIVFDGLPDIPATSSYIDLDGGDHGLLLNPRRCGVYQVLVRFVSHEQETVREALPLKIEGCPPALAVRRPRLKGGVLRWRLSEPATTEVTLLRRGPRTWRELRSWRTTKRRLRVGRLRPGEYRAVMRARTADGRVSRARSLSITRQ